MGESRGWRSAQDRLAVAFGTCTPADIIKSKKEANRPNDRAVLHVLERTLSEQAAARAKPTKREIELEAMRHVWEQDLVDMIRANLALPMHKRTHFLRKRLPNGGSTL